MRVEAAFRPRLSGRPAPSAGQLARRVPSGAGGVRAPGIGDRGVIPSSPAPSSGA